MQFALLVCAATVLAGPASAQTHPLVGELKLNIPTAVRGANGMPVPVDRRGDISVTAFGDSLIASLTRVCAYDRAGYGFSDAAARPSDAVNIVDGVHRPRGPWSR